MILDMKSLDLSHTRNMMCALNGSCEMNHNLLRQEMMMPMVVTVG